MKIFLTFAFGCAFANVARAGSLTTVIPEILKDPTCLRQAWNSMSAEDLRSSTSFTYALRAGAALMQEVGIDGVGPTDVIGMAYSRGTSRGKKADALAAQSTPRVVWGGRRFLRQDTIVNVALQKPWASLQDCTVSVEDLSVEIQILREVYDPRDPSAFMAYVVDRSFELARLPWQLPEFPLNPAKL